MPTPQPSPASLERSTHQSSTGRRLTTTSFIEPFFFVSEFVITCHTNWLDRAFHNATYGYQFGVPPGVHAQDTDYTFYNGPGTPDVYKTYNATVAQALQQFIINFTMTGSPNGQGNSSAFPAYGNGTLLNLTDAGFPSRYPMRRESKVFVFPVHSGQEHYWLQSFAYGRRNQWLRVVLGKILPGYILGGFGGAYSNLKIRSFRLSTLC